MPKAGHTSRIRLESDELTLELLPAEGGRVVSLRDRRSGREWLVQDPAVTRGVAPAVGRTADDAPFDGGEAFGWDECLPTVGRCRDPLDPDGPLLRDHGDGWGRPVAVEHGVDPAGRETVTVSWSIPGSYRFSRTLAVDRRTVVCTYSCTSLGIERPILWSMHPLVDLEAGSRIDLGPARGVTVSQSIGLDLARGTDAVAWPIASTGDGGTVDLGLVAGAESGTAIKLYVDPAAAPAAAHQPDGSAIVFDWDRAVAPSVGLWLDAGGWPAGEARTQFALEPTTAPFDDLEAAVAAGRATRLDVGATISWWATVTIHPPHPTRLP